MAFFAAVSSSIGKKLLLFALRQIDILDKDPADFVSVDVGKKTTLEVRDVGLHVKKLVALLHLKLPPEIHLSKAQASLLRVTFVLDFGVPQIIIEVDGVQVHARLSENTKPARTQKPPSPARRRASSPRIPDDASDASSEADDEDIPTVDHLAESFIRDEPEEEIRELEEALNTQSESLAESVASSDDGDDEGGVGAPLGLPTMLRNILNTALDRLQIIINQVDIEVEDQLPSEPSDTPQEDSCVSLNFHIDRISIDSVTSQDPQVNVASKASPQDIDSKLGRRRMRVQKIYSRLISDADNFATMSRISRPSSPTDTRSVVSSSRKSQSEASASQAAGDSGSMASAILAEELAPASAPEASVSSLSARSSVSSSASEQPEPSPAPVHHGTERLASSVLTADEDRFADAGSDDGLGRSVMSDVDDHTLPPRPMGASSILYDDEGVLEYAMQNNMLDSEISEAVSEAPEVGHSVRWEGDLESSYHEYGPASAETDPSGLPLPSSSILEQPSESPNNSQSLLQPRPSESVTSSTDNLDAARHHILEEHSPAGSAPESPSDEDLAESKLFTHDDAESMYMSAMSGPQASSNYHRAVPGGWDSSSNSSQAASDTSAPIPAAMMAGSILEPLVEADDGCETPRPGSRQSAYSSPSSHRDTDETRRKKFGFEGARDDPKLAKLFLTIDEVVVWFPLELGQEPRIQSTDKRIEQPEISFKPPNLGQDSIFQEMPGSFSNYAFSTSSRRKGSIDTTVPSRRPNVKPSLETLPSQVTKDVPASVSVEVGSVIGHIDLSTGRIMFQLFDRLMKAMAGMPEPQQKQKQTKTQDSPPSTNSSLNLSVKKFDIAWLERLMTESIIRGEHTPLRLEPDPPDAIIRINLSSTCVTNQITSQGQRSKVTFGKFVLSSLDQDVISFLSPKPRSRRSISSSTDILANDIEIDLEQTHESRITVVTRPVKVTFDLQKLDDALSSFGGFSGILDLASSISSSTSVNSPIIAKAPQRPRGVHFGDVPPPAPTASPSSMPKIHVQFGEVSFLLKGKSCAVQLQTTSVRAAIRDSNVRLKVSEIKLSGPFVDSSEGGAPLMVEVKGTTVNFLFAPEEVDLGKLISMITPSKDPYENDEDILVDILLRQRRKGSVLRAEIGSVGVRVSDLAPLQSFEALGLEIAKLSKVTKYLPDDDRPGILTLATVQQFDANVMVNEKLGDVSVSLRDTSVAHVGVPPLLAVEVGSLSASRGEELLIHDVVKLRQQDRLPMIMMRVVGDEMEPLIKAKLFNVCAEYRVSTIMAALGLADDGTPQDIALGLASSVATITGASSAKSLSREASEMGPSSPTPKPLHIDLLLRSCALGLNPRKIPSKALFVLTDAHFLGKQSKKEGYAIGVELRKASIHAIDDVGRISDREMPSSSAVGMSMGQRQLLELREQGYVSLSSISAAKGQVKLTGDGKTEEQLVEAEFKNELFVLESCADSTQTLIAVLNGLQPPSPPSTAQKYRTVVPLQEMMESFTGDAMMAPEMTGPDDDDDSFMENADLVGDEVPTDLEYVGSIYNSQSLPSEEGLGDSMLDEDDLGAVGSPPLTRQTGERNLLESFQEQYEVTEAEQDFDFTDQHFQDSDAEHKGDARKWDSRKNRYHLTNEFKIPNSPLKVRVRDVNIVWNLFDGYDWPRTRSIITQAVDDVEARAEERRQRPRDDEDDDDFVEQDFLFNSVWIGVPIADEQGALARRINHDIDDLVSETGSYATSTATRSTGATVRPRSATKPHRRRLKLERSKNKKISIQLSGIDADLIVFPPDSGETQNSISVRVHNFEIFDHVPTSTWNKFITSIIERSKRPMDTPMVKIEMLTVRPITELAASELVIKVSLLPLRLHVDQDALDFITRFFEFKDDSAPENPAPSEQPFIQRLEVMTVTLKLDYKPKRVDYRGIRSGHTTEFMNFLILEGADITLRHAIVYGITDFDKLHKTLNDVWMPDVKRNQLPKVLSGLAAVRPLVNVGSGMRDLVVVPMREYKKDGRIVRSLQKGVYAFAKNTTSEVARLGAKVAIGTQTLLEGAENFLAPSSSSSHSHHPYSHSNTDWDDLSPSSPERENEERAVSNYANQPIGVKAGLRSAARYLERDLLMARDAVIAIPAEIMEEGSGMGMARVLGRRAPTVILRPGRGVLGGVGRALLGVGNALDIEGERKRDDKYKSY